MSISDHVNDFHRLDQLPGIMDLKPEAEHSRVARYRELCIRRHGHGDRKPDANPPTDAELVSARAALSDFEFDCLFLELEGQPRGSVAWGQYGVMNPGTAGPPKPA